MTQQEVTTIYLEMTNISQFVPKKGFKEKLFVQEIENNVFVNFMLFAGVGLPWKWYSRLEWSVDDWAGYFSGNNCKTYLGFKGKQLIGYFELEIHGTDDVEIKFFGLFPQFIGSGSGGLFLSHVIDTAWQLGANRLWLHTCTNDQPNAIANYLARGFAVFKQKKEIENIPDKQELLNKIGHFFSRYIDQNTQC